VPAKRSGFSSGDAQLATAAATATPPTASQVGHHGMARLVALT
jgi:hypothetical protein